MLITFNLKKAIYSQKSAIANHQAALNQNRTEVIEKFSTYRLFANLHQAIKNWEDEDDKVRSFEKLQELRSNRVQAITALFLFVTIAVTVFTSSIEVFNGNLDVGALIALNIHWKIIWLYRRASRSCCIPKIRQRNTWTWGNGKENAVSTAFRKPKAFEAHASVKGLSLIYPQMRTSLLKG